jgi:flavin reductase (DIM6/NTAB) family NADH-FMN oxidoreductase RutF
MSRYKDVPEDSAYRLLYPAPVYVVSAASGEDEDALSAVWVTPVSTRPPRVGVMLSPERYSYSLIRRSKLFAVNRLPFRYVKQMAFIGDVSKRYQLNKIAVSGLHLAAGRTAGVRVIREADAIIECRLSLTLEAGDHDILIGTVACAYATRDFENVWDMEKERFASYLGSVGVGETMRRLFISEEGEVEETRPPRTDAVAKRSRDRKRIQEAGLSFKGREIHEAAKGVSTKTGIRCEDVLLILEEMRRQGLLQLGGRLSGSDFG